MCVEHIQSPVDNAKRKIHHIYTGPTTSKIYDDMVNCDQEGLLMVSRIAVFVIHSSIDYDCRFIVQKCIQLKIVHFSKSWEE